MGRLMIVGESGMPSAFQSTGSRKGAASLCLRISLRATLHALHSSGWSPARPPPPPLSRSDALIGSPSNRPSKSLLNCVVGPVAGGLVAASHQLGLDSAQVHRVLDHLGILRKLERLPIDGHQKGAGPRVALKCLQHTEALLGVLICFPAWRELLLLARLLHHWHQFLG